MLSIIYTFYTMLVVMSQTRQTNISALLSSKSMYLMNMDFEDSSAEMLVCRV